MRMIVATAVAVVALTACGSNTVPEPPTPTNEMIGGLVTSTSIVVHDSSTTTTTTTTTIAAVPSTAVQVLTVPGVDRWDQLAQCETGGNWSANTGNGFGGGLQFAHASNWSTWLSYGGGEFAAHPWEATREQQIVVAERVFADAGWRAWPGCSRKNGWL